MKKREGVIEIITQ